MRYVAVGFAAALATIGADALFRASLLRAVRPVIVSPTDGATVLPPVILQWEGPRRMHVALRFGGRAYWDLGIRESPFELPANYLARRGLYAVDIWSPTFGHWISARRTFAVERAPQPNQQQNASDQEWNAQLAALQRSIEELKGAQEKLRAENAALYEENAAVREENAILTEEINRLAEAEQRARGQVAAWEQRHSELAAEHQRLLEEVNALRMRVASVLPCTVWGYYSYPRPQRIPATRRAVTVSDARGEVFRVRDQCEAQRTSDPTAASPCFCVGNSWGG